MRPLIKIWFQFQLAPLELYFKGKELAKRTLPSAKEGGELQDAASSHPPEDSTNKASEQRTKEQGCSSISDAEYDAAWRADPHRGGEHRYVAEV